MLAITSGVLLDCYLTQSLVQDCWVWTLVLSVTLYIKGKVLGLNLLYCSCLLLLLMICLIERAEKKGASSNEDSLRGKAGKGWQGQGGNMAKLIQSTIEAMEAFLHVQSHLLTLITVRTNGKEWRRFSVLALKCSTYVSPTGWDHIWLDDVMTRPPTDKSKVFTNWLFLISRLYKEQLLQLFIHKTRMA